MEAIAKLLIGLLLVGAIIGGYALLFALPLMWLWDYLMPAIFGLKVLTFWQALAMGVLSGILFRSGCSSKKD